MDSNFCPNNLFVTMNDEVLTLYNSNYEIQQNYTHSRASGSNIWRKYFVKYINEKSDDFSSSILEILSLTTISPIDLRHFKQKKKESMPEIDLLKDFLRKVDILTILDDDAYDDILSENIVFLDLIDASAVNTIIECIVRNTPVIVNKIKPTIELLGDGYPLFYESLDEIINLLDDQNITNTHIYLKSMNKEKYKIENFVIVNFFSSKSINLLGIYNFQLKSPSWIFNFPLKSPL